GEQSTGGAVAWATRDIGVLLALLPAASVAVTVIVCVPKPTSVPAAGDWLRVIALVPLQESLTVTPPNTLGTAAWQVPSVLAFGIGEQFTVGAVASVTVKIEVQVALLPAASVAVTVMVCAPKPTSVPAAGDWLRVIALVPLQESLTVTPANTFGTAAWQWPSVLAFGIAEQFTIGDVGRASCREVV